MKRIVNLIVCLSVCLSIAAQIKTYQHKIDTKVITVKPKNASNAEMKSLDVITSNALGYYDIAVPINIDVNDYVTELRKSNKFESVEYNFLSILSDSYEYQMNSSDNKSKNTNNRVTLATSSTIIPNDSLYTTQPWLKKIQVDKAWKLTMGSPSTKVAIIDTGIDTTHVDLGMGTDGYSNISASPGINCDLWWNDHGTICAGIIGAKTNNGKGIAGIAGGNHNHGTTIYPYFVTHFPNTVEWNKVDNYILDATADGAKIIYIGFWTDECNSSLIDAINYAYSHGVTIIGGSGFYNTNSSSVALPILYPAALEKVIAVGAAEMFSTFGQDYRRDLHSAYGSGLDIVAPGNKVTSTKRNQQYNHELSGSDLAAAHVAGVVALMLSVNPQLTPAQVKQILRDTAIKSNYYSYTNGWNQYVGCGLVDAYAAVLGAYLINISGPDRLCGEEIYTINNFPSEASVSLGTNNGGFWIQKSSNISFDSYNSTTGELSVQQTTPGDGYLKVFYDDHLLATKEFWVGGPKITNFYYTGNTLYVESDGGLRYYWNINGTQFSSLSQKYYPLADGTYNVSVYTTSPNCGAGPTYTTQLHVSGGNMYSLGPISSDHQVTIETTDYSDSPQPLEAMQTMTSKQAAKDVPYELKNAMTSEVSARGEMPAEGGVLDFSRVRSGLYVLTLSPAGREPETFKISLK